MMFKLIRVLIALSLVLGIVLVAQDQVASAAPVSTGDFDERDPGTVKPPRRRIWTCQDGTFSIGGAATLNVSNLAPDYCLRAFLQPWKPLVKPPTGAGRILAPIVTLQIFYRNRLVAHLPEEDGNVEICFAIPPGKEGKIYFLASSVKNSTWIALDTSVENGLACAPAQDSGAYALIGQ